MTIRKSNWWIKSKDYGKVTVGVEGTATYHLLDDADGANTRLFSGYQAAGVFMRTWQLRSNGAPLQGAAQLTWSNIMLGPDNDSVGQSTRLNIVRYNSPTFEGFTASTAWGADDIWDAKLNYKGEIGDFALLAQVGYAQNSDELDGVTCSGTDAKHADCHWWCGHDHAQADWLVRVRRLREELG